MQTYVKPEVRRVGSLHELTQSTITKTAGHGDFIVIAGQTIGIPGSTVTKVS